MPWARPWLQCKRPPHRTRAFRPPASILTDVRGVSGLGGGAVTAQANSTANRYLLNAKVSGLGWNGRGYDGWVGEAMTLTDDLRIHET